MMVLERNVFLQLHFVFQATSMMVLMKNVSQTLTIVVLILVSLVMDLKKVSMQNVLTQHNFVMQDISAMVIQQFQTEPVFLQQPIVQKVSLVMVHLLVLMLLVLQQLKIALLIISMMEQI